MITKWLKDSGLIVNEEKTEICLFYKRDHPTIELTINEKRVKSKKTINVLGILFDSKLQWSDQASKAINNSKKALHGIKILKRYLTKEETKMLLTSNFYSVLYYNCEVWLSSELKVHVKQQLLAASSRALKVINNVSDLRISYLQLHIQEKRATPMKFVKYKLAVQLHKIYNRVDDNDDWLDMNEQQNFNARNENFHINDYSRAKIGRNVLCNRLTCLNGELKLEWLNLTSLAFKLKAKSIFLTN